MTILLYVQIICNDKKMYVIRKTGFNEIIVAVLL